MTNVDTKHYTILEKSLSRKMVAQSHIYPEYSKKCYLIHPLIASLNYIGIQILSMQNIEMTERPTPQAANSNILWICVCFFFWESNQGEKIKNDLVVYIISRKLNFSYLHLQLVVFAGKINVRPSFLKWVGPQNQIPVMTHFFYSS